MSLFVESAAGAAETQFRPLIAAVNVDLDKSVLLQVVLFAVLVLILKPLLFDPMLRVFAEREARTDGARAEAREMQERAAEILANYEKELARVRAVAAEERDRMRAETARLEAEVLQQARATSEAIIAEGRKRIEAESAALRQELQAQAAQLSGEVTNTVLGRGAARPMGGIQ